ncbi:flagellar assembly protein FliW [Microbacterium sp. XT11]|uniref:flagellar assembly protein FliW n=1 Tax=Microbacterium sp. XT11 TaxID=367477 RepID=UPI00082C3112|nr:flagellar assembly protein FliW [Microbacterium sp. XT11]
MTLPTASAPREERTESVSVRFVVPMPGLAPYTEFTLVSIGGAEGLYALRAVDADVRLFLVDAAVAAPGCRPSLPDVVRQDLGAADGEPLQTFVVANPAEDGVHVNLRAPVVMHARTGLATQVILDDQALPLRMRLEGTGGR